VKHNRRKKKTNVKTSVAGNRTPDILTAGRQRNFCLFTYNFNIW